MKINTDKATERDLSRVLERVLSIRLGDDQMDHIDAIIAKFAPISAAISEIFADNSLDDEAIKSGIKKILIFGDIDIAEVRRQTFSGMAHADARRAVTDATMGYVLTVSEKKSTDFDVLSESFVISKQDHERNVGVLKHWAYAIYFEGLVKAMARAVDNPILATVVNNTPETKRRISSLIGRAW